MGVRRVPGFNGSLVVVLVLLSLLQFATANKYCVFEIQGEPKYYVCPNKNENCCSIGCCVNLAFHFYQLWYYWLLVIFLFMLCSGGGWWFRFCRSSSHSARTLTPGTASRYSSSSSSQQHPSNGITSHSLHAAAPHNHTSNLRASSSRTHNYHQHAHHHHHHLDRNCPHHRHQMVTGSSSSNGLLNQQQRARILHRPCGQRNSMYYLQRIWKGPNVIQQQQQLPPSYSTMFFNMFTNGSTTDVPVATAVEGESAAAASPPPTHRPLTNNNYCPYYQLYGPPPSYDSVIQLTTSEGVTTSCCLVEPPSTTQLSAAADAAAEAHVQVNRNQDEEETIQEIVISEPATERLDEEAKCMRSTSTDDVLEEEEGIPLISVKCSGGTAQLEDYDGESEVQVVSTRRSASRSDSVHSSCAVGAPAAFDNNSCATPTTAHQNFEDVPSTSSLSPSSS